MRERLFLIILTTLLVVGFLMHIEERFGSELSIGLAYVIIGGLIGLIVKRW